MISKNIQIVYNFWDEKSSYMIFSNSNKYELCFFLSEQCSDKLEIS